MYLGPRTPDAVLCLHKSRLGESVDVDLYFCFVRPSCIATGVVADLKMAWFRRCTEPRFFFYHFK